MTSKGDKPSEIRNPLLPGVHVRKNSAHRLKTEQINLVAMNLTVLVGVGWLLGRQRQLLLLVQASTFQNRCHSHVVVARAAAVRNNKDAFLCDACNRHSRQVAFVRNGDWYPQVRKVKIEKQIPLSEGVIVQRSDLFPHVDLLVWAHDRIDELPAARTSVVRKIEMTSLNGTIVSEGSVAQHLEHLVEDAWLQIS